MMRKAYNKLQDKAEALIRPFLKEVKKNSREDLLTWPNAISAIRIALAILVVTRQLGTTATLAVVGAAAVSDFADGVLAQRFFGPTRSGKVLDPACDKIFVVCYGIAHWSEFNPWALGTLGLVEVLFFCSQMFMLGRAKLKGKRFTDAALSSNMVGKLKILFECSAFLAGFVGTMVSTPLLILSIAAAIVSAKIQAQNNPVLYEN